MTSIIATIKKHPIFIFFSLTFVISWSGIIIVSFFTGMPAPSKTFEAIAPLAMLPLVVGPTVVSILLIGILYGKEGFTRLFSRILTWRVNFKFYLFAVLTLPVIALTILMILSQFSSDYIPNILTSDNKANLLISGLLVGILLTFFEEIGWTGFAIPELRKRFNVLSTGLILGALWGAWHFLPVFFGCGDSTGNFNFQLFYPGLFFHYAGLIPFRILMTLIYDKTNSLLLPWIMHATLTSCTFFILNISKTGLPLLIYYIALSIILWIIVVFLINNKNLKTGNNFSDLGHYT